MNLTDTMEYINSMPRFIEKPVLEVMKTVLCTLDNPQDKLKFIHVAGTNGKGSACAYISSIAKCAGLTVGKFTSPYVVDFRERFQINDRMISKSYLCEITTQVKSILDELGEDYLLPQFALITVIGFLYFLKNNCDVVVLEVGLGGRTDPTNIIKNPLCSVIMQIGLDHTDRLGDNIGQIAFEKGGIIKPNGKTVLYPIQKEQTVNVIRSMSIQSNSKFIQTRTDDIKNINYSLTGATFTYKGEYYEIGISGKCQPYNALTAIEAINASLPDITTDIIKKGLKNAQIPARLQVIRQSPALVVDGGHNEDAVNVLIDFILRNKIKPICVIGMSKDKDIKTFIHKIGPLCREIHTVQVDSPRAETAENIATLAQIYCSTVKPHSDFDKLIDEMLSKDDDLLICGSLYVANYALNAIKSKFDI